jgi:hypothetical protein
LHPAYSIKEIDMKFTKLMSLSLWSLAGMLAISGAAHADESADSQQAASNALTSGLGRPTARVLQRVSLDRSAVAAELAARFGDAAARAAAMADGSLRLTADDWRIVVAADGTAAAGQRTSAAAPPVPTKLDLATLERLGRAFIATRLAGVVVPRGGERMVVLRSNHQIQGGQDASGRRAPDLVRAHRIVFGREIDRLRVVGGGSTVSITFGPDGAPVSFEYDWPQYTAGATVAIASPGAILERVQRVAAARSGGAAASIVLPRVDASRGYPVELGQGVQLSRAECGYFDPGTLAKLGIDLVQPACQYAVLHTRAMGAHVLRHGLGGAVPAAITAVPDDKWPELRLLSGTGGGAPAPGSARL